MLQLLKVDEDTLINPQKIIQITIGNLQKISQERGQRFQTPEQREYLQGNMWEISIYLRSDSNGYNPQRWTKNFKTRQEANNWIKNKFSHTIVEQLI